MPWKDYEYHKQRMRQAHHQLSPEAKAKKLLRRKLYNRLKRTQLIRALIDSLGGSCRICGITDPIVLQLDHIKVDAAEDRKLFTAGNRDKLYWSVINNPDRDLRYQLLCANCHARKTAIDMGWISRFNA